MIIFSIKNEEINYFNRPMYFDSVPECKNYVLSVLTSDADRALFNLRDKLALYSLGEISFSTGEILATEPLKHCDLCDIFAMVPDSAHLDTHKALRELEKLKNDIQALSEDIDKRFISCADELSRCKKRR